MERNGLIHYDWLQFSAKCSNFNELNAKLRRKTLNDDVYLIEASPETWIGDYKFEFKGSCKQYKEIFHVHTQGVHFLVLGMKYNLGRIPKEMVNVKIANQWLYEGDLKGELNKFLTQFSLTFNAFSRIDVCVDTQEMNIDELCYRIASKQYSFSSKRKISSHGDNLSKGGLTYEGISINNNRSDIRYTWYNKSKELRSMSDKPYILEKWERFGFCPKKDVTRFECKITSRWDLSYGRGKLDLDSIFEKDVSKEMWCALMEKLKIYENIGGNNRRQVRIHDMPLNSLVTVKRKEYLMSPFKEQRTILKGVKALIKRYKITMHDTTRNQLLQYATHIFDSMQEVRKEQIRKNNEEAEAIRRLMSAPVGYTDLMTELKNKRDQLRQDIRKRDYKEKTSAHQCEKMYEMFPETKIASEIRQGRWTSGINRKVPPKWKQAV